MENSNYNNNTCCRRDTILTLAKDFLGFYYQRLSYTRIQYHQDENINIYHAFMTCDSREYR
jgi:hypothetical protein